MINLDSITNKNNKKHNEKWQYIPDHPYRILIIGGFGSEKTITLLNLISEQNDIDKIYLYVRDLNEPKYKNWIKKRKDTVIKPLNDPMHLSNVQIRWMMSMRIFMTIIQAEKEKSWLCLMI